MEQRDFPSGPYLRKGQTLGSLQQAAQLIHLPLRLLETGSIEVKVLFILADQVFLLLSAISQDFPDKHFYNHVVRNLECRIPETREGTKPESEDYLLHAVLTSRAPRRGWTSR
jgi:hypothetical protein